MAKMADSKYADLPGICSDEPDVYECGDLPEAEQSSSELQVDENDSVERIHITATDAFNKFLGKTLDASQIDFSDKISRRLRTGYDARSGNWQLAGAGDVETPMEKYQRLLCEMKELNEEVSKIQAESSADSSAKDLGLVSSKQVQEALRKLADIRLEESLGKNLVSSITNPQGTELQKLFAQLEQFKQSMVSEEHSEKATSAASTSASGDEGVVFQLNYHPEQTKLLQTARMAELEKRLHRLESVLGASDDKLSRLSSASKKGSLLETVDHLTATASVLNSSQLDHIEGRLTALQQKMDAIIEKKKEVAEDDEKDKMILELYDLLKNSESISSLLPKTIERLKALENLHTKAADFTRTLAQVETLQGEIVSNVQNNKTYLQGVQASFVTNLEEMNKTVVALDNRIKATQTSKK